MTIYSFVETMYSKSRKDKKAYLDAWLYTYATKEERDSEFVKAYNRRLSDDLQDKALRVGGRVDNSYQIDVNKDRIISFELYDQEIG